MVITHMAGFTQTLRLARDAGRAFPWGFFIPAGVRKGFGRTSPGPVRRFCAWFSAAAAAVTTALCLFCSARWFLRMIGRETVGSFWNRSGPF